MHQQDAVDRNHLAGVVLRPPKGVGREYSISDHEHMQAGGLVCIFTSQHAAEKLPRSLVL